MPATAYIHMFNGTPYKNLLWRLLGVRIGRRVFDDGCHIVERSMVSVGSGCTFRGVNPAFVTGTAALRTYWRDDKLERATLAKGQRIATALTALAQSVPGTLIRPRGRGMAHGLAFENGELAGKVSAAAFERGLLVETCGPQGTVIKSLPPLTITGTASTRDSRRWRTPPRRFAERRPRKHKEVLLWTRRD